ncbi:hypothetical protein [Methanobrevibacter sp.]|uniref:hypothetical protein n=1 Tax=Methanobrevibacter sp. TaxID=66852 RepID=UPI00388F58FE
MTPISNNPILYSSDFLEGHKENYITTPFVKDEDNDLNLGVFIHNYTIIYNFIIDNVLEQYDELDSCELFYEDEEGNPSIEYYLKYVGDLSFKQLNKLDYEILEKINDFCISSKLDEEFENMDVFLVRCG